ncbi:MAG: ADP-ribosylglycohydrolase family protein, partial [Herpetosiphonaceae bacterium]|nr:ADP-ribosylglycohydrolase family protein [Herpetosiphonaceae bacterium]
AMADQIVQLEALLELKDDVALPRLLSQSKVFGSPIEDIIQTSVYGFIKSAADFEQSVIFCANAGWDTDTMAAINGNIAGAWNGLRAIPDRWLNNLENGYKGRDYLLLLARSLHSKTPLPRTNALVDYMKDFWRNVGFISNMIVRKPKM